MLCIYKDMRSYTWAYEIRRPAIQVKHGNYLRGKTNVNALTKINKTNPNLTLLRQVLLEKPDDLWGFLQLEV